ncbi:hypothetical protein [Actinomadura meyerae]|nr:hypothetical protein [Actinomadura meyerae]
MLSRHLTSEGVVTYTRCACGRLQMRVQRFEAGAVVAAGRRDAAAPDRP